MQKNEPQNNESSNSLTWFQSFNLSVFHVDHTGFANFYSYFNLMQEAATQHAHSKDFGIETMRNKNKIWVVTRFELHVFDRAKWGENLLIETWSRGLIGRTAHRDFLIYKNNEKNEKLLLGKASSVWVPIDLTTRQIALISSKELETVSLKEKSNEISPRKIEFTENKFKFVVEKSAQNSDIDLNQHVNNAKYVQWIYDAIAFSETTTLPNQGFAINYISEINRGDRIKILRNEFQFAGQKENGKLAFTAEFF